MLTPEQITAVRPKLLMIQIIAAALTLGVVVFLAVVCVIVGMDNFGDRIKMLTVLGAVTAIAMFALSTFAPGMFANPPSGSSESDPGDSQQTMEVLSLANSMLIENLIRYCLIEAAIFLNLMVLFIDPHIASLIVAVIGILLMLIYFPRQSKMIAAIEDRLR